VGQSDDGGFVRFAHHQTITERLKLAVQTASRQFPELAKHRISPHVIRHSVAMHMLQSGVDITIIALWLGHESPVTTHRYVEADLQMKDRALQALQAPSRKAFRYKPKDDLLRFLQAYSYVSSMAMPEAHQCLPRCHDLDNPGTRHRFASVCSGHPDRTFHNYEVTIGSFRQAIP
jgi:hypothetical protein